MLHGVLVPLAHRVGRRKSGRTVHFELVPVPVRDECAAATMSATASLRA